MWLDPRCGKYLCGANPSCGFSSESPPSVPASPVPPEREAMAMADSCEFIPAEKADEGLRAAHPDAEWFALSVPMMGSALAARDAAMSAMLRDQGISFLGCGEFGGRELFVGKRSVFGGVF